MPVAVLLAVVSVSMDTDSDAILTPCTIAGSMSSTGVSSTAPIPLVIAKVCNGRFARCSETALSQLVALRVICGRDVSRLDVNLHALLSIPVVRASTGKPRAAGSIVDRGETRSAHAALSFLVALGSIVLRVAGGNVSGLDVKLDALLAVAIVRASASKPGAARRVVDRCIALSAHAALSLLVALRRITVVLLGLLADLAILLVLACANKTLAARTVDTLVTLCSGAPLSNCVALAATSIIVLRADRDAQKGGNSRKKEEASH